MDELFDAFDIPAEQRGALRAHLRRALGVAVRDDWWGATKKRSIADPALTVSDAGAVAALERIDPRLIRAIRRTTCALHAGSPATPTSRSRPTAPSPWRRMRRIPAFGAV